MEQQEGDVSGLIARALLCCSCGKPHRLLSNAAIAWASQENLPAPAFLEMLANILQQPGILNVGAIQELSLVGCARLLSRLEGAEAGELLHRTCTLLAACLPQCPASGSRALLAAAGDALRLYVEENRDCKAPVLSSRSSQKQDWVKRKQGGFGFDLGQKGQNECAQDGGGCGNQSNAEHVEQGIDRRGYECERGGEEPKNTGVPQEMTYVGVTPPEMLLDKLSTLKFDVHVAIELLAYASPVLSTDHVASSCPDLLTLIISALEVAEEGVASRILSRLLPVTLAMAGDEAVVSDLWRTLKTWSITDHTVTRIITVLCAHAEHFLPNGLPTATLDLRLDATFWYAVQQGLSHVSLMTRKRAVYMLKRIVDVSASLQNTIICRTGSTPEESAPIFWWTDISSNHLLSMWEHYILIMQSLEETQFHIVKPVISHVPGLLKAIASPETDKSFPALHVSWLTCMFSRMLESRSKAVVHEGVTLCLSLDMTEFPFMEQNFDQFICGPLLDALLESALYVRSPGQPVGSGPFLDTLIRSFFTSCILALPTSKRGRFLCYLARGILARHWSTVPLLFLGRALAAVPHGPFISAEGVSLFREIICTKLLYHSVSLRAVTQSYLLRAAIQLSDASQLSLDDVSALLSSLPSDESFCRVSGLWTTVCHWLALNDGIFTAHEALAVGDRVLRNEISNLHGFVLDQLDTFMQDPSNTEHEVLLHDPAAAARLATMALLAADISLTNSGNVYPNKGWILETFLDRLQSTFHRLSTRPYFPLMKADKVLHLLLKLLHISSPADSHDEGDVIRGTLRATIENCIDELLDFLLGHIYSNLVQEESLNHVNFYLDLLKEIVNLVLNTCHGSARVIAFVSHLVSLSLANLRHVHDDSLKDISPLEEAAAMAALAWVCQTGIAFPSLRLSSLNEMQDLIRVFEKAPFNCTLSRPSRSDTNRPMCFKDWGRVSANFINHQWTCVSCIVKCRGCSDDDGQGRILPSFAARALRGCREAFDLLPAESVLPVLRCLEVLVPQTFTEKELCAEVLRQAWTSVLNLGSDQRLFWPALKVFIRTIYHSCLLELDETAISLEPLTSTIRQILVELVKMSETKSGIFNILIYHCCQTWLELMAGTPDVELPMTQASFIPLGSTIKVLLEACVFGPVFRKEQRIHCEVSAFLERTKEARPSTNLSESRDDQMVRIVAIDFLRALNSSFPPCSLFISALTHALLEKAERKGCQRKPQYFANSAHHRQQNRVWQCLLLLLPSMNEACTQSVLECAYRATAESHQVSVQRLIEWLLVLLLHRHPSLLPTFWEWGSYKLDKGRNSICSFFTVLVHLIKVFNNDSQGVSFARRALSATLPWCMSHSFGVRLHALLALGHVWEACKVEGRISNDIQPIAAMVESCLENVSCLQGKGNVGRNWRKIRDNFFFANFHPVLDYSVQTIFYSLPRLTGLNDDEWIEPGRFTAHKEGGLPAALPLYNTRTDLVGLEVTPDTRQCPDGEVEDLKKDVQKKVVPWQNMIPDLDLPASLGSQEKPHRTGSAASAEGLVVVASLIDKPTNLGGLCRTCEIFGVSSFVIESLQHLADKQFQSLSVTAEQWICIKEVKVHRLADYLFEMKQRGYTVVGVEQTANSRSLAQFSFPQRTLLLLGNEREGIPAPLLHELDVCVEIPQRGVVRSLNVHVSGALLIWEYARQHLIDS
uniref:probable methyltransferase TARBP1 isoform X1 n=2 Tax=Myxine glutinosa TaxID=7769 RepID=UPI00358F8850